MPSLIRVVSLVPSLSELVAFLNPEALIGRTRFCVFPTEIIALPHIGGTKNVDIQRIRALKPDLILAAKEENIREQVEELALEFRTEVFDIQSVDDALQSILLIGEWMSVNEEARRLVDQIKKERQNYQKPNLGSVIYLIWQKPWMTVGGDTYINAMLFEAGFSNLFSGSKRYPVISTESEFVNLRPDYLLLSSEPFPFKDRDVSHFQKLLPDTEVNWVDGTFFSWYGNRLKDFYPYLKQNFKAKAKA